jgi:glycosyltransferase involved in cell wall biosynthesis
MKNKTIFIFTDYFLPGCQAGGPVTSMANLVTLLEEEFNLVIITRNKDLGIDEVYKDTRFDVLTKYKNFNIIYLSEVSKNSISQIIEKNKPDLIYLNSFFSLFTQFVLMHKLFSKSKTPLILAPRGELQVNALEIKKVKKKIYLFLYKIFGLNKDIFFHATDKIEKERIEKILNTKNIQTISNVPRISESKGLEKKSNELKLIFISRIRDNKNLHFALELLKDIDKNIQFDIYGPIEDKIYWDKCQKIIQGLPKNILVTYKGVVSPLDILETMKKYHALLLPTKTENFGHVIVEAMISGVIPIISNQTPWLELENKKVGWDLALDDKNGFVKAVEKVYEMDENTYSKYSQNTINYVKEKLQINQIKNDYINLFKTQLNIKGKNNVQK